MRWATAVLVTALMGCAQTGDSNVPGEAVTSPKPPNPSGDEAAPFVLEVSVVGEGRVVSEPAGIDCPGQCTLEVEPGQRVTLRAQRADGSHPSRFDGWSGACDGWLCALSVTAEMRVEATFAEPPVPVQSCAELLPIISRAAEADASVEVALPGTPDPHCLSGTSDREGRFALSHLAGTGPVYPQAVFYRLDGGQPVRVGEVVPGGDEGAFQTFGQRDGFLNHASNETTGYRSLRRYSGEGELVRTELFGARSAADEPSPAVVVPSQLGGLAVIHRHAYVGYGSDGLPRTPEVPLGVEGRIYAAGVTVTGNVLVLVERPGDPALHARWFAGTGEPLTDGFEIPLDTDERLVLQLQPLINGSLALSAGGLGAAREYRFTLPDAQARLEPAPSWLVERPGARLSQILGGRAYAAASSPTCVDGVELVTGAGESCGCLGPVGNGASVGLDGSLIVPDARPVTDRCVYRVYPGLFR